LFTFIGGKKGFAIATFVLFIFAALRNEVGNDYCGYQYIFENFSHYGSYEEGFGRIEPLYAILNILLSYVYDHHQIIFITVAFIQYALYLKISSLVKDRWLLFFIVLMFFYSFNINTIRFGLANIIFLYGFLMYLERKPFASNILALVSILTHVSTLPLILLFKKKFILFFLFFLFLYSVFIDYDLLHSKLDKVNNLLIYEINFRGRVEVFLANNLPIFLLIYFIKDMFYKIVFSVMILIFGIADMFIVDLGRVYTSYVFVLLGYISYIGVGKKIILVVPLVLVNIYGSILYLIIKLDSVIERQRLETNHMDTSGVAYKTIFNIEEDSKCVEGKGI
jgi:hypothetical protein